MKKGRFKIFLLKSAFEFFITCIIEGSNPSPLQKRLKSIHGFDLKFFAPKTPKKPVATGFKGWTSILFHKYGGEGGI